MSMTLTRAGTRAVAAPVCFTKPATVNLCVYRGDSGRIRVTVTGPPPDSLPIDVSGAAWDCDIRADADADPPLVSLTVEPVPGEPSKVDVVLSAADSALLSEDGVWDLEMTLNGEVTTLLAGKVLVTRDVSRP